MKDDKLQEIIELLPYSIRYSGEIEELLDYAKEQAERVEELEKENKLLRFIAEENKIAYEQRAEQNKRYREALEFYAEQDNYEWETSYRPQQEIDCMVIDDGGHTARKALKGESE